MMIDNKKEVLDNLVESSMVVAFHQTTEERHKMVERTHLQSKPELYQIDPLFCFQSEVELMIFTLLSCPHTSFVML